MTKLLPRKAGSLLCLVLILGFFASFLVCPNVKAEPIITSMTPAEGAVGTTVNLLGNITTANGTFQVFWDNSPIISNASATGNSVNVTFQVPPSTLGSHAVVLVANGENYTRSFSVLTAYSLVVLPELVSPAQSQEGDSFQLSLNVTGGNSTAVNVANFAVTVPSGLSYVNLTGVAVGNDGNGTVAVSYPGDFSAGASTNFTGQYGVSMNGTLATASFYVGLTNSSAYHRNQALDVKAVYSPGENVSLSITGNGSTYSENVTADDVGIVHYVNSTFLLSAPANTTYTLNLTSVSGPTKKVPPDIQSFTVPGFAVNITVRNLAGDAVQNTPVRVFENLESLYNLTSDSNGLVTPLLEVGSYFSNVSLANQEVGTLSMTVNETSTVFDIYCNLTNLLVITVDENGVRIPHVALHLAEQDYPSVAMDIGPTDVNATAAVHSLLPLLNNTPVDYVLNASLYGTVFNTTEHLELPVAAWFNLTIIVPKMSLQVNVTDGSLRPIGDADVNAIGVDGGLFYSGTTSADGTLTLRCTFGRYLLRVSTDGIELNETTVDVNSTTVSVSVSCTLYGLNVSVRVTDYFGQPIPNLNVTLQGSGYQKSIVSGSDGVAVFRNIVGGDLGVAAYSGGQSNQLAFKSVYVDNSTTITMEVGKYFVLAGMLVEVGSFVTVVMILLTIVFVLCLEIFRRRRLKSKQSEG